MHIFSRFSSTGVTSPININPDNILEAVQAKHGQLAKEIHSLHSALTEYERKNGEMDESMVRLRTHLITANALLNRANSSSGLPSPLHRANLVNSIKGAALIAGDYAFGRLQSEPSDVGTFPQLLGKHRFSYRNSMLASYYPQATAQVARPSAPKASSFSSTPPSITQPEYYKSPTAAAVRAVSGYYAVNRDPAQINPREAGKLWVSSRDALLQATPAVNRLSNDLGLYTSYLGARNEKPSERIAQASAAANRAQSLLSQASSDPKFSRDNQRALASALSDSATFGNIVRKQVYENPDFLRYVSSQQVSSPRSSHRPRQDAKYDDTSTEGTFTPPVIRESKSVAARLRSWFSSSKGPEPVENQQDYERRTKRQVETKQPKDMFAEIKALTHSMRRMGGGRYGRSSRFNPDLSGVNDVATTGARMGLVSLLGPLAPLALGAEDLIRDFTGKDLSHGLSVLAKSPKLALKAGLWGLKAPFRFAKSVAGRLNDSGQSGGYDDSSGTHRFGSLLKRGAKGSWRGLQSLFGFGKDSGSSANADQNIGQDVGSYIRNSEGIESPTTSVLVSMGHTLKEWKKKVFSQELDRNSEDQKDIRKQTRYLKEIAGEKEGLDKKHKKGGGLFGSLFSDAKHFLGNILGGIGKFAAWAAGGFGLYEILKNVGAFGKGILKSIYGVGKSIIKGLGSVLSSMWKGVSSLVGKGWSALKNLFGGKGGGAPADPGNDTPPEDTTPPLADDALPAAAPLAEDAAIGGAGVATLGGMGVLGTLGVAAGGLGAMLYSQKVGKDTLYSGAQLAQFAKDEKKPSPTTGYQAGGKGPIKAMPSPMSLLSKAGSGIANYASHTLSNITKGIGHAATWVKNKAVGIAAGASSLLKKASPAVRHALSMAAKISGLPIGFLAHVAYQESGFKIGANNPAAGAGGAVGLFQFVPQTWYGMLKKYGRKFGVDISNMSYKAIQDLRKQPELNAIMGGILLKNNGKAEGTTSEAGMYLGNFLGASVASKVLNNPDKTLGQLGIPADYYKANPSVLWPSRPASQVVDWARGIVGSGSTGSLQSTVATTRVNLGSDATASTTPTPPSTTPTTAIAKSSIFSGSNMSLATQAGYARLRGLVDSAASPYTKVTFSTHATARISQLPHPSAPSVASIKGTTSTANGNTTPSQTQHCPNVTPAQRTAPTNLSSIPLYVNNSGLMTMDLGGMI